MEENKISLIKQIWENILKILKQFMICFQKTLEILVELKDKTIKLFNWYWKVLLFSLFDNIKIFVIFLIFYWIFRFNCKKWVAEWVKFFNIGEIKLV